jgi:NAD(P)-dependent dehydrogenase (short-subunit alcohol dehydrogenase family)
MPGSTTRIISHTLALLAGLSAGFLAYALINSTAESQDGEYSIPNQPQRFARAKAANDIRVLDIDAVYNPSYARGRTVLITGGNRGIGYALAKEYKAQGARVIVTVRKLIRIEGIEVISDIDVTDDHVGAKLIRSLNGTKVDILINNAGYFYGPQETLTNLNFNEELSMINICALGPLRITSALVTADLLPSGARVAMITSQGGSISWRRVQNPTGGDYGHHMSKAAANMMGMLVSQELKEKNISVSILHPGFNKTDMTKKYEKFWAVEGAVDVSVGAKRVIHEIGLQSIETTGNFVNCEDGLQIPW